jgi:hypothetical protein
MTTLVINHVVSPLNDFWKRIERGMQRIGYARAASELRRQGYGDLADRLVEQRNSI